MNRRWLGVVFAAAALAFSAMVFTRLPEQVPTHFNIRGEPDDWTGRTFAAFSLPVFALLMMLLFHLFPKISPRRTKRQSSPY